MVQLACGDALLPALVAVLGAVGDAVPSLPLHPAATAAANAAMHKLTRVMSLSFVEGFWLKPLS
jgi:hypothetical protein